MQDGARLRWIGPPASSRAFSLIELLVGIGIVLVLMGIAVASVVRAPRLNRMVAAEQLISDVIRQARHTARTSGQPVVVRLDKGNSSIAGLVRQPLWHGVEGWPGPAAAGLTGGGLGLPAAYSNLNDAILGVDDPTLAQLPHAVLRGGQRLWRGGSIRASVLLSVAVRPPEPAAVSLPLILVGPAAATASPDFADVAQSIVGLGLRPAASGSQLAWNPVGWCGDLTIQALAQGDEDRWPIQAGRWTEICLLIEPSPSGADVVLTLYRDGRAYGGAVIYRVGTPTPLNPQVAPIPMPSITEPGMEQVYVGLAAQATVMGFANGAVIDNVRIERLGDAMAATLPAAVVPDAPASITCHPDGAVDATTIRLTASGGAEHAEITVSSAGLVTTDAKP